MYNGWTNHATWAVNLWVLNDESTYREWRTHLFEDSDDVKIFVYYHLPANVLKGILSDLGIKSFVEMEDKVNWEELLESWNEE